VPDSWGQGVRIPNNLSPIVQPISEAARTAKGADVRTRITNLASWTGSKCVDSTCHQERITSYLPEIVDAVALAVVAAKGPQVVYCWDYGTVGRGAERMLGYVVSTLSQL